MPKFTQKIADRLGKVFNKNELKIKKLKKITIYSLKIFAILISLNPMKNRNVFEKSRKGKQTNSGMTFRFGQIRFMLESHKSYSTSTYVFLWTCSNIHIASTACLCIAYIVLYIHTHNQSSAAAVARISVARKLYICQTNKRTNVLITLREATKRKLQQKSVHQQRRRLQSQSIVKAHSETKHHTPLPQSIFNVLGL